MISAIILAAGHSKRMGQPKMLLPWAQTTVIGKVIATLGEVGLDNLYVMTGGNKKELENALGQYRINYVFNPDYVSGDMLSSVQVGLRNIPKSTDAALIVLGDQPQIEASVVKAIVESYSISKKRIVVPSYQMHRGHPWLIDKSLWDEILDLKPPYTLRDYLKINQDHIQYVTVDTPSIIQDLDTPNQYQQHKPK